MYTRQMSANSFANEFTPGSRVAFDNDHYGGTGEVEDIVRCFQAREASGIEYTNCSILIRPGSIFNMKNNRAKKMFAETGGYVTIDLYSVNTRIDRIVCNVHKIQPIVVLERPLSLRNDSFIDCF